MVNGHRVDQLAEEELIQVRGDLEMIFEEGALFRSLTVRENVGYKLYEETDTALDEADRRVEEVLGFMGMAEHIDKMPAALSGEQRRRSRSPCHGLQAADSAVRRGDDGPRPDYRDDGGRRDHQAAGSRRRDFLLVTHQLRDAFYLATHMAIRDGNAVRIVPAPSEKSDECEFIMLTDGGVCFEGDADELRQSPDPYL